MEKCPCHSGMPLQNCCQPIISGTNKQATPDQLARARYTAHVTNNFFFLQASHTAKERESIDWEDYQTEAKTLEWLCFDLIKSHSNANTASATAVVTVKQQSFVYRYQETSCYVREESGWYFSDSYIEDMKKICPCDKSHCLGCY